jgi:hypothetical protein
MKQNQPTNNQKEYQLLKLAAPSLGSSVRAQLHWGDLLLFRGDVHKNI